MDANLRKLYQLMQQILIITIEGMELERLPQGMVSAEALGVSEYFRANVLRMMHEGGLIEGRVIEGRELAAINLQPTLEGLEWLEYIREKLKSG